MGRRIWRGLAAGVIPLVLVSGLAGLTGCGESSAPSPPTGPESSPILSDAKNKKSKAWRKVGKNLVYEPERAADDQKVTPQK